MLVEEVIEIEAAADAVWRVLAEVEAWPGWTESIASIEYLEGRSLEPGARVRIVHPRLPPAVWTVTSVEPGSSFAWETRGPGVRSTASHTLEPRSADRTRVTLTVRSTGFLAPVFALFLKGITRRYVALEAAGLKSRCESG